MKRLAAFSIAVMFVATAAAHADHSTSNLPEVTQKPGDISFGLEQAMESVSLALTFDREKKVKKRLKYAEERLVEANQLAEENKTQRAEKAVKLYSRQMTEVNRTLDKIPEEERQNLRQHVRGSYEVQAVVLKEVLKKTPEAANKGIKTALENSDIPVPGEGRESPAEKTSDRQQTESDRSSGYTATGRAEPAGE